ncbi:uncharacterized protein [Argopecten irradians]|uniref:uncharacterized protein n=1 Tax=Argopecten irradians TaxID=31199 RepID=UPI003712460F
MSLSSMVYLRASRGSNTYNTAMFLAKILSSLVYRTAHHIKNSTELVKTLSQYNLSPFGCLVSDDATALFTSVTVQESQPKVRLWATSLPGRSQPLHGTVRGIFQDIPRYWGRYADDTLAIICNNVVDNFTDHLNNYHPATKFTIERMKDNSIPVLDPLCSVCTVNPYPPTNISNSTAINSYP